MSDDMVAWLRAQLDEDEMVARVAAQLDDPLHMDGDLAEWTYTESAPNYRVVDKYGYHVLEHFDVETAPWWTAPHIAHQDPARTLREVEAKRLIVDMHLPIRRTVEWPHDQDGTGHGMVCSSCGNRDTTAWDSWHPPEGEAGVLPEGVIPPYILAPCLTLRLVASVYAGREGYRAEWRPA